VDLLYLRQHVGLWKLPEAYVMLPVQEFEMRKHILTLSLAKLRLNDKGVLKTY
jgi:hypothetical protein